MKKRVISLLLVMCMLLTTFPATALAADNAIGEGLCSHHTAHDESCGYVEGVSPCSYQCAECAAAGISFSSTKLALTAEATSMREDCGALPITLTRYSAFSEQTFTVAIFDSSTTYGADYTISYNGVTAQKIEGSQSIYDTLRDYGEVTDGVAFDLAVSAMQAAAEAEAEQSGGEEETVSAASMLAQLDELNARATEIDVTFPAGTATQTLYINVIDDEESEYEESFMLAAYDEDGEVIEGAQQSFSIVDNEAERPSVTVYFDCEDTLELTDDDDSALLVFRRTGDLATGTLVTLYCDGEAYGQVDFSPYQTVQAVDAVIGGIYTLEARDGVDVDAGQVEVIDKTTTTYSVGEGGDEDLDAVPDEYAVIRTPRTSVSTSWVPKWVTNGSTEAYEVVAGTTSNNLYTEGGGGAGGVTPFVEGNNFHNVSTRRSRSTWSKGHRNMDLINAIDLIGVESVETTVFVDAIDEGDNVEIKFGIEGLPWNTKQIEGDSSEQYIHTFTAKVPTGRAEDGPSGTDYRQESKKVYYSNVDPDKSSAGTDMYVPNALKLNLRKYRFIIESDPNNMAGFNDHMKYGADNTVYVPTIEMPEQILTINTKDYGTGNKEVVISYNETNTKYPARLVGFRVKKYGEDKCSDLISLKSGYRSGNNWIINYKNSFTFDEEFLRKYEKDYCVYTQNTSNSEELWTFQIIPIYEKIYVGKPEVLSSEEGGLTVTSIGGDCLGDQWKIEKTAGTGIANMDLCGVWYQAKNSAQSTDIKEQKITMDLYSDDTPGVYTLDITQNYYTIQGVWSNDAAQLLVEYDDTGNHKASERGSLLITRSNGNVVIPKDSYVVGEFVPLIAQPNEGYYTRWRIKGTTDYYYGNTFYYQLDGYPAHNLIYVDFVSEAELRAENLTVKQSTLKGNLWQSYVEAKSGLVTRLIAMDETDMTISASTSSRNAGGVLSSTTYTTTTNDKGEFTINDFVGIAGGTYSVAVLYESTVSYTTFVYNGNGSSFDIQMPQFPTGHPYPDDVYAYVSGQTEANTLNVTDGSTIVATTRVCVPDTGDEKTITSVEYCFAYADLVNEGISLEGSSTFKAQRTSVDGDYEIWTANITGTSDLISGMRMYVTIYYTLTSYQNSQNGVPQKKTVEVNTGLVDTGYDLHTAVDQTDYAVSYNILSTPGMQDLGDREIKSADSSGTRSSGTVEPYGKLIDSIDVPAVGKLDFGFSGKNGGFFTTRVDASGNTYMMCGSTALNYFATGTITQKYAKLKEETEAFNENRAQAKAAQRVEGGANTEVGVVNGEADPGSDKEGFYLEKGKVNWSIEPAYLFMFTISPKSDGSGNYLSGYLMTLGFDAFISRNFPMTIYGIPFYASVSFTTEAYYNLQVTWPEELDKQVDQITSDELSEDAESGTKISNFIGAPVLKAVGKGGIGFNGFLGLYLTLSISFPFIIQIAPDEMAAQFACSVGLGAELGIFNVEFDVAFETDPFGTDKSLISDLQTITQQASGASAISEQSIVDQSSITDALRGAISTEDIMEQLNTATFSPIVTGGDSESLLRMLSNETGSIAKNVFKNTGVHLLKQDDGSILAFYLEDTRNGNDETLNYLTVAYAESNDNGEHWTKMGYVSDNTSSDNTSLQYGVNLYELGDGYTLVTWSEADFDEMIKNTDININKLTPAQIAKFMNAMSLKGKLMYQGDFVGEAFTISETANGGSTVYCGALDAVKNGDTIYVYYQRNIFPESMSDGTDVTLSDIVNTKRAIALARAEINEETKTIDGEWKSTAVTAKNENGTKEYRITEVEPFVHDGVMGEILVLDRDGKLAEWDSTTETWVASNEDRQLYLRTYTFGEDGTPQPSALMAITDPTDCCQNPQVVSNDKYLHLFYNQNGKIVYVTDFVATTDDAKAIKDGAFVVVDKTTGEVETHDPKTNKDVSYCASSIASDDEHLNIGTTFSASMDEDGHVLLSWVATEYNAVDPAKETDPTRLQKVNDVMSEEVFGVVLETVSNAGAVSTEGSNTAGSDIVFSESGNADVMQLTAKGSPIALTDENGEIKALDSVFLGDESGESSFLLAFSKMNYETVPLVDEEKNPLLDSQGDEQTKEKITSADVKSVTSNYTTDLTITSVSAPQYPMPGEKVSVKVTVANNGLKEAENVVVSASGVGSGSGAIESILPGCSETITLTVAIPDDFKSSSNLNITAEAGNDEATASVKVFYGPHFIVTQVPSMSNIAGSSDYTTATMIYNDGNADGTPKLYYEVNLFADDDPNATKSYGPYTPTVSDGSVEKSKEDNLVIEAGGAAVVTYTLEDTPVESNNDIGMLTVYTVDPSTSETIGTREHVQGQMPRLASVVQRKSDIPTLDDTSEPEKPEKPNVPGTPGSPSTPNVPDTSEPEEDTPTLPVVSFTDVSTAEYYYDAVRWAVENKITDGTSSTTFGPNDSCTRAHAVTFLWRAAGCPEPSGTVNPFTDVSEAAYYYKAVLWAVENGITKGTSTTTFSPDATCERGQIVTFLWRAADGSEIGDAKNPFTDVGTQEYHYHAVLWAVENGITKGTSTTTFGPGDDCTRGQIVTFLYRYAG